MKLLRPILSLALVMSLSLPTFAAEEKSDAWLVLKVKAALLANSTASILKTKVDSKDGIVTLSGEADSKAQKDSATDAAQKIDGVKSVHNEMTIVEKKSEESKPNLSGAIDDMTITAKIKSALFANKSTSGLRTLVVTKDGVVTLSGKARTREEKQTAEQLAKDVQGVKKVINQMDIDPNS
jgi:hyperosmotically inducible protein